MRKADRHLFDEWAAQYPVGSKVEVKFRGWATGIVTRHNENKGTIYLQVKTERFGVLYYAYGSRRSIRKG